MKFKKSFLFVLFLSLIQYSVSYGQTDESEIEDTNISILTCKSGNQLYSTFGHTAIRIFNPNLEVDQVYNYGVFSFNTPYFYIKFMRGQLPYFLGVTTMENFLREYHYDQRSVIEQELILNNEQKKEIIEFLVHNAQPENRSYRYDFFYDNCATRVVDVFSMPGAISYSNVVEKKTFRDLLKENLQSLVWSDFGIDIVIGARADILTNRRHQMFLPEYVMTNLETAKVDGMSMLAKSPHLVLDFESLDAERKKKATNWPMICTSLLLLITILVNMYSVSLAVVYNKALLVICGVLGLFLLFMWFGTNHGATRDNWNVMWFNPIILIYLFSAGKVKKMISYAIVFLLSLAALNCIVTFLPQFFNVAFLPIILSLLVVMCKDLLPIKKVAKSD